MKRIFKYHVPIDDSVSITMKIGAKVLTVQAQREDVCIWALVNPAEGDEIRRFKVVGTGHRIEEECLEYIGTVQMFDGGLVLHVFEVWARTSIKTGKDLPADDL